MRVSCVLAGISLVLSSISIEHARAQLAPQPNTLKPFTTDGCSMWIDGTSTNPYVWRHCCVAHDKDYWLGGTEDQRKRSDENLRACIIETDNKAMGEYIYMSVRWGGAPQWMMPYRWGYGWDYLDGGKPRGYKVPSELEQEAIKLRLPQAEQVIAEDAIKHPALSKGVKKESTP